MSLGIVLDVAIGLVFTYLLLAIIVSGLIELIAGWAKWRPNDLRKGIAALLGADKHPVLNQLFSQVFQHGLIAETSANGLPIVCTKSCRTSATMQPSAQVRPGT
jgi:hypothetical protein